MMIILVEIIVAIIGKTMYKKNNRNNINNNYSHINNHCIYNGSIRILILSLDTTSNDRYKKKKTLNA